MEDVIKSLHEQNILHPVIIILGCREDISQVFLTVEGHALPITMGVVSAVDRLLKVHFILNMEYAVQCKHILHFLQRSVIEVADDMPLSRGAADLLVYLRNKKRQN